MNKKKIKEKPLYEEAKELTETLTKYPSELKIMNLKELEEYVRKKLYKGDIAENPDCYEGKLLVFKINKSKYGVYWNDSEI